MSLGIRQLPALVGLTFLLAGGVSALGAASAAVPTATNASDAEDGLALPQRPAAGLAKIVLRMPAPLGVGGGHRPLLAGPVAPALQLAKGAEPGSAAPLYDLLRVYRL